MSLVNLKYIDTIHMGIKDYTYIGANIKEARID